MEPFLALTVPVVSTEHARARLVHYLPHVRGIDALSAPTTETRSLWLHPRIRSPEDLPVDVRTGCEELGTWDVAERALTDAERVRLFTVVFFSKSSLSPPLRPRLPDSWRRVLSNFHPCRLSLEGAPYASVEHYFQGQKALCSDRPEMAERFRSDAEVDAVGPDPLGARRAGGRSAYRRAGATLDVSRWEACRVAVMQRALEARWAQDGLFREILVSDLLHFERSGADSFWGGSLRKADGRPQGENWLGKLLMDLRASRTTGVVHPAGGKAC